jgi:DNA-binding protein YbaB
VESADGDVFHRNVNRFIETFSTQLNSTLSQLSERAAQVHGGEDSGGNAQVDLDSRGTIVGLRLDETWLRTADGRDVTDAIRSALSKAQTSVAAATPALPFEGTPLAQYAEGMADPVEMIRMLTRGG